MQLAARGVGREGRDESFVGEGEGVHGLLPACGELDDDFARLIGSGLGLGSGSGLGLGLGSGSARRRLCSSDKVGR